MTQGYLAEIFYSHQGEASWLGRRQVFVRLAGCELQCQYCDTRWAQQPYPEHWRLSNGRQEWRDNPVTGKDTAALVRDIIRRCGPFHSVAFTGGEPLEQPQFLENAAQGIKEWVPGIKLFLETNGLVSKPMQRMKGLFHFVAMDIKLPSTCGQAVPLKKHAVFLSAVKECEGCVKAVVRPETKPAELAAAAKLAHRLAPDWDFILQPATGPKWGLRTNHELLDRLSRRSLGANPRTRVIPQVHRLMGIA